MRRFVFHLPSGCWWNWLAAVCWAGLMPSLAAAAQTNEPVRYNVRVWQTDDGLPQNSVWALAQTPDGYLWVGTREGLARFDGVRFTTVDDPAAPQLRQSWITALCTTRDGSLWIASESNGLTRLKDGVFTQFLQTNGLPDNQVQCLLETRDGTLWIGGETGLGHFRDGHFRAFLGEETLHNNSVKALHEDPDGILCIATVTGLVSINTQGVISRNNFGRGVVTNVLKAVTIDRRGQMWLGTTDGLLCLQSNATGGSLISKSFPRTITTVLHEDRSGQLWIGSYSDLKRQVDGVLTPWWLGKAGIADLVYTLLEDREHNFWVGGRDGLYRLSPARFVTLTMQEGLNCNNVTAVCEDRAGTLWLGTWGGGLNRLRAGQLSTITATNGLTHDYVLSLHSGRTGKLFVGMELGGGVNRLGRMDSNDFPRLNLVSNAAVRTMYEDRAGALWIGTGKGLNIYRGRSLETYTVTEGLAGNNVMVLFEDHHTNLWVGTDGGLSRWTGLGFSNFTTADGLSQNYINSLYEDVQGSLWIGTRGGGVNRWRNGQFTSYTMRCGLFSDEIFEILEDDSDHLWMSCRRGIFRVERAQFDQFDQGLIKHLTCTSFGREDGLETVQCSGVSKPAGWKTQDGRLWFPTIRGVIAVEPRIRLNDLPPPLAIEELLVDQRPLWRAPWQGKGLPTVVVPPGSSRVEVRFTALSLEGAEKNRFKYQLEGVDESWIDAGAQRVASYNNLKDGRYRFKLIGSNNDGVWNDAGLSLLIRVQPHYWQTWWFRIVVAASVLGVLYHYYRSRVRQLREIEQLRIRIASDLHDDVGSRLTKVAMVTEIVNRETAEHDRSKPHLQNISSTVREITRAMDEIVWTINPRNDTLDHLANYIFQYAQEYFQNTGVRCRLDVPAELPDHPITTEERHNIFMAVKEALTNALKHAEASEVRVGLFVADDWLTIAITDNGRGLAPENANQAGNGLPNMKQRLQNIGGRLTFESRQGFGTTVTMEFAGKWST